MKKHSCLLCLAMKLSSLLFASSRAPRPCRGAEVKPIQTERRTSGGAAAWAALLPAASDLSRPAVPCSSLWRWR